MEPSKPYRYFVLWQPEKYVNMPGYGWRQEILEELPPSALVSLRGRKFAYVEDCVTREVVFSSLDLVRSMHVSVTRWPDRDKMYRLLKHAKST